MSVFTMGLTPTQKRFCQSTATVVAIIGPEGEGKTTGAAFRLLWKASALPASETLRGVLIRDTGPNIEQHTIPSLQKTFGAISTIRALKSGGWVWEVPRVGLEMVMFGIDDLVALSRLQGSEYDFGWLEEPSPIISGGSAGLREEVFTILAGRRGSGKPGKFVQISMNPAAKTHWTYRVLETSPLPGVATEVFHIARGENPHLLPEDRQRQERVYASRPDLYARYILGDWGPVQMGESVTPEYRESKHWAPATLDPLPGLPVMRAWDGWHHPACVFFQRTSVGRIRVLDAIRGDGMGIRQFIPTQVRPLLASRYRDVPSWRDVGDESMRAGDQSDRRESAALAIEEMLGTGFEGMPNEWASRLESVRTVISQPMVDAAPMLAVSRSASLLNDALAGGWHYPTSSAGVVGRLPIKDPASHVADAFAAGCQAMMGVRQEVARPAYSARKRAQSYAMGVR